MSRLDPTKEKYDRLIYKLATLETELDQVRKLVEAPQKAQRCKRQRGVATMVALAVMLLLHPTVSRANESQQKALRGLKGVSVFIELLSPAAERLGLSKDLIKADVELRLRKVGVMILTEKEMQESPGMPFLYVKVTTVVRQDSPIVDFSIRVALTEWVTLARGFKTPGEIWNTSEGGSVGTENIMQIREPIGDLVDKFINDYLAVNPIEAPKKAAW